jgi:DNA-binding transcriptional ArsR family regulator
MGIDLRVSSRLEFFLAACAAMDGEPPVVSVEHWGRLMRRADRALPLRLANIGAADFWIDLAIRANSPPAAADADPLDLLDALPLQAPADSPAQDARDLRSAIIDVLRRFQRQVFLSYWRQAAEELESAVARLRPALAALAPAQLRDYLGLPAMPDVASARLLLAPTAFPVQAQRYRARISPGEIVSVLPFDGRAPGLPAPPPEAVPAPSAPATEPDIALVFRALGDATRYAIATLLAREALTGADLARRLGVTQPTMTHHLQQLRRAGLLKEERRGNSLVSRLDRDAIGAISEAAIRQLFGEGASGAAPIRRSRRVSTS